ncbi:hypothetical protein BH11MYX1_BH11MYX1_31260 [soil metagenome]
MDDVLEPRQDRSIDLAILGRSGRKLEASAPLARAGVRLMGVYLTWATEQFRACGVVAFYRGGWCPFCDLQLRAYQNVLGEIRALGAELVAISPQLPSYAEQDVEVKALTFPVAYDANNAVARTFGLVFELGPVLQQLQTGFGSIVLTFNGGEKRELPIPGTYVIDREGIVRLAHVDPNYTVRLEPTKILATLRDLE